jgi:hypothetical protein
VDVARERLWNQRIEARPLKRAVDVVRWLVASQAQDFAGAKWALGLRTSGATEASVEKEFDDGRILRTHLMRPTWHFVAPEDIRWMLSLTAPRVNARNAHRYRQLELDAAAFRTAERALAKALAGGRQLTRDELREVLVGAGIGALDGQRMAHLMMRAELDGVVCSGARRGKQFTYALLEERAPRARTFSRDDALVELAGRYFRSRGPATPHDFAKWSGLSIADARRGLEAVEPRLRRDVIEGRSYWSARSSAARRAGPPAHLLSVYDEYVSSYRDRSAICDPAYARRLVGMGNALAYVAVVDGQLVGTWRRALDRRTVHVELTAFRPLGAAERRALLEAARRFAGFLGRDLRLELAFRPGA